jgi:hypothetical protein
MENAVFYDEVLTPEMEGVIVNPWAPGADQAAWQIRTFWMPPGQAENFRQAQGLDGAPVA